MKQMKILGVLAMAAALGLTACGGGGGKKSTSSKHTHKWGEYKEVKAATCTEDGSEERECSECHEKQTRKIAAAHSWGEWQITTAPTCTEVGSRRHTCSKCNAVEDEEVPANGHSWGEWVVTTEPDCVNPGSHRHTCSVCNAVEDEEVPANGHSWGEWETLVEPTCTKAGSHKHTCSVCNAVEDEPVAALGHDIQLIGDETEPEAGKAKVRVYTCANNCGTTYLGFKANEVSEESQKHLSFKESQKADGTTEVGASFWGRPIGNALALKADGSSVAEQVDECVYCSTETGDFFEYIFDLTEEQVQQAGLDECRLYLDAKPADYMNGGDFFAYGGGNTDDWTPGFYIDGADDHIEKDDQGQPVMVNDHARPVKAEDGSEAEGAQLDTQVPMGKRITDYRYILYVDDQVQQFEQNVSNPTHGNNTNMTREEFCLPFVFNLHKGENKIRLCMAGGYRSTFYNFTFRPVEEQGGEGGEGGETHVHEYADAKAGTLTGEGFTAVDVYNCKDNDASALRWEAKNYDASSNEIEATASDGSIRFNRAQGKNGEDDKGGHLVYKINSPVAGKDVELSFYIQAHSQNVAIFDAVANDSGAGKDVDADGKYTVTPTKRYALYVNGARIELGEDPGASNAKAWFKFPCKFDLNKGENTIELVALGGYRAKMYNFQLSGLPKIGFPVKTWSSDDVKAGLTEGKTLTEKDFNNSLAGVKGYKFNKADTTCTLTVEMEAAGTFDLALLLGVKKGNQSKTGFWYQVDSTQSPLPAKDKITVNGTDVVPPENDVTFEDATVESDQSDNGTLMVPVWKTVCQVSLNAGPNSIVISYLSGGYSLYLCGAQLMK